MNIVRRWPARSWEDYVQTKPLKRATALLATAAAVGFLATAARADITIGVTLSTTGPTAALGVPMKNALELWPKEIAGEKLNVIFLDDAGDPTQATTNARRFVTDDKVDVIVGSDNTPTNIAIGGVAAEAGVPHIACAPTPLKDGREKWTFVMPQSVPLVGQILLDHMKANNVKSVGYIGFSDSYGDLWANLVKGKGAEMGLSLVDDERFARADTSVSGQVLKLVAAKPDAILVGASGAGAALPQVELRNRGYTGPIYQTHGAVSFAFIKIAGPAAEGVLMASGPVMVPEAQPDSALTKKPGLDLDTAYEAKFGPNTRTQFAGHIYDSMLILEAAVPLAMKTAKPGTREFHAALKNAIETVGDVPASQGVYHFTATDHQGLDERARVLLTVKDGKFQLVDFELPK
jgi:branched-chain amino acid transport system substrate-binding protein